MKQFNVPETYRSSLITRIKSLRKKQDKLKKDFAPTLLDFGTVRILLARHFGFCYGVENAIEIAYQCIEENPGKKIFLLSEMIHNPQVNENLQQRGIQFLQDTYGNQLTPFETLTKDDVVIIPAFGTTLAIEAKLNDLGITPYLYNTTCPFVEKVWNRGESLASKGYSLVVHGKPKHEETRATFSRSAAKAPSVIVNDMDEAIALGKYITKEKLSEEFYKEFSGRYSDGFNIEKDLQRIGVINQTTQLATDTLAIADYLKNLVQQYYRLDETNISERFADNRDTLCYATNDNQSAVKGMLQQDADLALIVGGYNSSNTSHLVELCEYKLPSYYINGAANIISTNQIDHFNWRTKGEVSTKEYLPGHTPATIMITSGASCPDAVVEEVIERILDLSPDAARFEEVVNELEVTSNV